MVEKLVSFTIMTNLHVLLILFLLLSICFSGCNLLPHAPLLCTLGSFHKCPGLMVYDNGKFLPTNSNESSTLQVTGSDECRFACIAHPECYFAEYHRLSSRCLLHKDGTLTKCEASCPTIHIWQCCMNSKNHCMKYKNHCPGYWIVSDRRYFNRTVFRSFKSLPRVIDARACRDACTKNPICNAVDFRIRNESISLEGACSMFSFNDELKESHLVVKDRNYSASKWTCCVPNDSDLKEDCRSSPHLCDGYWQPSKKFLPNETETLGNFHAGNKWVCMKACEEHPNCTEVYYNPTHRRCLMKGLERAHVDSASQSEYLMLQIHPSRWNGYNWTCCDSRKHIIKAEKIPSHSFDAGAECICPRSKNFLLAGDSCNSLNDTKLLLVVSVRAAFWFTKGSREVKRNGIPWTRVNNGVTYVWINKSLSQLSECPVSKCHLYSTKIDPESCPSIVPVEEWFGHPPKKVQKFTKTPKMISITNFYKPQYLCYCKTTCSDYIRDVQFYHQLELSWWNLAYNFMIGNDGRVYAGRGFEVVGSHTYTFNSVSYGIAFIGWFEHKCPSIASLRVVKEFINCMSKNKYISEAYSVHAHRDLRTNHSEIPGAILYDLMHNWPHYNGLISRTDCPETNYTIIIIFVLLVLVLISSYVITKLWRFYRHQNWCSLRLSITPLEVAITAMGTNWKDIVGAENEWPTACVIRVPNFFSIDPEDTTLKILYDRERVCPCLRQLCLLWGKCRLENSFTFANLVHQDLAKLRVCSHFTILLLLPGRRNTAALLFLLHFPTKEEVHRMTSLILSHECICRVSNVNFQEAISAPVSFMHARGTPDRDAAGMRERFDSMLMENCNPSSSLEPYQRLFLQQGQHRREITWSQWKEEQNARNPAHSEELNHL